MNFRKIILRYPYQVVVAGVFVFSFLNVLNDSGFREQALIEWHDVIAQFLIGFAMAWWLKITIQSNVSMDTYQRLFWGCTSLIWLMTIKFFGELYAFQTPVLTTFELLLAVSGISLLTWGFVSWSEDLNYIIEHLKVSVTEYRELSEIDPLTGLFNRRQYEQIMKHTGLHSREISLVLVDLDKFKSINDQYGHPIGDTVLRRTASLLSENLRGMDYAFRMGGEEFALLYLQCPRDKVEKRAQTILELIASEEFSTSDNERFSITASIGVVHLNSNEQVSTLYKFADAALYEAKENGRNQVVIA